MAVNATLPAPPELCHIPGTALPVKRLKALDVLLLLVLLPAWGAALVLHVRQIYRGRLAWVGVFVAAPATRTEHPTVRGFWPGTDGAASGLLVGDRLVRAGGADLRGIGPVGFVARAASEADAALRVPIVYERDGRRQETTLQLTPARYPWRILPLVVSLVGAGALVLLRVPDAPIGRAFFLAALAFAAHWTFFPGGPPVQTYAWAVTFLLASLVTFPLWLRAVLLLPEQAVPAGRPLPWWPWVFSVFGLLAFSWVFGTPLPPPLGQQGSLGVNVVFIATLLAVITRGFRRAGPVGRRQLKWVVYGLYMGLVPVLLTDLVTALVPRLWWLHEAAVIAEAAIPLSIITAIVRFNFFDIDRLIAATAVYTFLSIVLLAGLFTLVPPAARIASGSLGFDPSTAQVLLSGLLAASIVPGRRYLTAPVDRYFFSERYTLSEGIDGLLRELALGRTREELLALAGQRLQALLRTGTCSVYAQRGDGFGLLFQRGGPSLPALLPPSSPMLAAIASWNAPMDLQGRGVAGRRRGPGRDAVETLAPLRAQVILAVRRGDLLAAFVALGEKRSGDVYTTRDLALLSAVANQLSGDLLRLDLGRYAPRTVVETLLRDPSALELEAREVTVLFSDMRGSTRFAEALPPEGLRLFHDEFFPAMADVVGSHGGLLVKTIGDAVMALWNAPLSTPDHAARAAGAALEMLATLEPLNRRWASRGWPEVAIRVGIHTGDALVGNFGSAARVEYDARGDTVNVASRLEGLCDAYAARVVVSEATRGRLGDAFLCRPLDRVRVRGRSQPVDVHEILALRVLDGDGQLAGLADDFTAALEAYRARRWDDALLRFERLAREHPDDRLAQLYLARCRALRAAPPREDWDGVFEAPAH